MTTEHMLKSMVETLTKVNERQSHQIDELTRQVKELSAQVAWFQRQMFGRKSEKCIVLVRIRQLYHIEHECDASGMDFDGRKATRLRKSKPVMDEMKAWLETEGVKYSESSLIGKTVTYAYTRWENMERVLQDGHLLLDNNLAENEIRPITLGRKNYLFCGNHEAATNICVIASLLATCHNHNVNPRAYLTDVIASMPRFEKANQDEISVMLPQRWIEYHPEAIMPEVRKLTK